MSFQKQTTTLESIFIKRKQYKFKYHKGEKDYEKGKHYRFTIMCISGEYHV